MTTLQGKCRSAWQSASGGIRNDSRRDAVRRRTSGSHTARQRCARHICWAQTTNSKSSGPEPDEEPHRRS